MKKTALIFCGPLLAPAAALAGPTCSPSSDTARILATASPNAIHRSWQGGRQLGYGWSLQVERSTRDAVGTEYFVGDLYDPNGHLATRKVFAIESEWDCGP